MTSAPSAPATFSIAQVRSQIHGRVIGPEDAGYDQARTVFVGGIDRRPAVIVRVVDTADVARVIAFARETGLPLAVRSGGHGNGGQAVVEGGIVLDLRDMRAIDIDVDGRTAWAQAGMTALEYSTACGVHGLATGFGDTGSVGIGGITLGGGIGYLVRKHRLTIDSLLAAELVTANGELLQVDAENHPDLFWAIRGGGGNFGVATRFRYRLAEVGTIVGGMLIQPATAELIAAYVTEAEAAPDELTTIANVMPCPPMPFVPEEHHGRLVVMSQIAWAGDAQAGERALAPIRALGMPIADMLRPIPYPEIYPPEGDDYHPMAAGQTMFLDRVDVPVAETILEHLGTAPGVMRVAQLRVLGGAMARVPNGETAFAHRGSRILANLASLYEQPEQKQTNEAWSTDFEAALHQDDDGAYVNFLGDEGAARIRDAYPGSTWDRLVEVKTRYDPTNLFRLNQNIPPANPS